MTIPAFETIKTSLENGVATLTLNRPDKLNAWNSQMMLDLRAAFEWTDQTDEVRAVIITGEGRAFCSGVDSSKADTPEKEAAEKYLTVSARKHYGEWRDGAGLLTLRIFDSLKPVIAAVNGASVGAGATIQMGMDIRMASTEAKYGFVFTRRAITPEGCSTWFLSRHVGLQMAFDWIYTGRWVSAQEALEKGLVHSVHEPDQLLPAARALAEQIATNAAPVPVAAARRMLLRMAGAPDPMEAHIIESRVNQELAKSPDRIEGVKSSLEKRTPEFTASVSANAPEIFRAVWGEETRD